jgi:thiol-disulfide isomerase/thioredoxin
MGRRIAASALTACAVAALLAGCRSDSGDASGVKGDGTSFVSGKGVQVMVPVAKRGEPVSLSADTLGGDSLDLATLRGKPVVVNVWGSWCPPCRKEAPALAAAAEKLKGKASFVGVDTRDDDGQALAYERRFKVGYPSVVDNGTLLLAFQGAVAPTQIPSTLVLDEQGRIAARFSGPVTETTLVQAVQDVGASS